MTVYYIDRVLYVQLTEGEMLILNHVLDKFCEHTLLQLEKEEVKDFTLFKVHNESYLYFSNNHTDCVKIYDIDVN